MRNGESDFESRGFTDGYQADYISVQCLGEISMSRPKIYAMTFAKVYPLYVAKAERKGRIKAEVDEIIRWLTGYDQAGLEARIKDGTELENFFLQSPKLNPLRTKITGVVCGVRVEEIEEETMREIRYLDKLIDELAKGKPMAKILRE